MCGVYVCVYVCVCVGVCVWVCVSGVLVSVQSSAYFDGGGQPGNAEAWEDDRTNAETLDFFRGTRATLEGAYLRPRTATYIELQDRASPLVTAALAREITDAQCIRQLNDLTERLLEES